MVKRRESRFYSKKLEPHNKNYNIKFDGIETINADAATIAEIEEAYANGAKLRMRITEDAMVVNTTHDYLKSDSLIDVTKQTSSIVKELKKGRLSYPTRMTLHKNKETQKEEKILIFTIERAVQGMKEDIKILKSWMDEGRKIWRISIENAEDTLMLVAYLNDPKCFDEVLKYLERFTAQKQIYLHNLKIQFLYEEELVNPKLVMLFEPELQQLGFTPVKSAQEEYKKIQQIMRTAAWVNGKVKKNEGTK